MEYSQEPSMLGEALIKRFEILRSERAPWETTWKDIDKYVFNTASLFSTSSMSSSPLIPDDVYDTTAVGALDMLTSVIHSGLTGTTKKWLDLTHPNAKLKNSDKVKRWISETVDILLASFNSSDSSFSQQNHETLMQINGYGTGCMYVDMDKDKTIHFNSRHLSEIFTSENSKGRIDTVMRKFEFTARNAVQEYGEDKLSDQIKEKAVSKPDEKLEFIHACIPVEDARRLYKDTEPLADIFNYVAYTVCIKDKKVVKREGYAGLPYIVGRFGKLPGRPYGTSPAWKCLPDIKMLNAMSLTEIKTLAFAAEPLWGAYDDGVFTERELDLKPNSVIMGAIGANGEKYMVPLNSGAGIGAMDSKVFRVQENIRRAFFVQEYFQKEGTPLSATEVQKKIQDSQILGAPNFSRIQSEYLTQVINRVFRLHLDNGLLPPIPPELVDDEGKLAYEVVYISPFVKQQRFDELEAMNRTINSIATLIQLDPSLAVQAAENFDIDGYIRSSAEVSGVPLKVIREYDLKKPLTLEQYRQQKAEQQQAAMTQQAQADAMGKGLPPGGL